MLTPSIDAVTLFVEDMERAKLFYQDVLGEPVFFDDQNSAVFNAACVELRANGVALINGPMNRAWGVRTASFADPGGHIWEIAQQLPRTEG